jgi:hypothetical protein
VRDGTADDLEGTVRANWFNGGERLASVIERADGMLLMGGGGRSGSVQAVARALRRTRDEHRTVTVNATEP